MGFVADHNARFARSPARPDNLHRPLNEPASRLKDILCHRDERAFSAQLVVCYECKRLILQDSDLARAAAGRYLETFAFADGRIDPRWKGISLPYRIFDKDQQRLTYAAITEKKRLSAAVAHVMELQQTPPKPLRVGKQATVYTPTGRRNDGWSSGAARTAKRKAASIEGTAASI